MELEIKAIDGCPEDEHAEFVELHIRREQRWAEVLRHLMQDEPADLMAVMFDGVDKLQHLCWRFIDPACRPEQPDRLGAGHDRPLRALLPLARRADRGSIVELAGPDATVVLASDHGFGPTRTCSTSTRGSSSRAT